MLCDSVTLCILSNICELACTCVPQIIHTIPPPHTCCTYKYARQWSSCYRYVPHTPQSKSMTVKLYGVTSQQWLDCDAETLWSSHSDCSSCFILSSQQYRSSTSILDLCNFDVFCDRNSIRGPDFGTSQNGDCWIVTQILFCNQSHIRWNLLCLYLLFGSSTKHLNLGACSNLAGPWPTDANEQSVYNQLLHNRSICQNQRNLWWASQTLKV